MLWGDVPALMPMTKKARKHDDSGWRENGTLISCNRMVPDGQKVPGFRFDGSGKSFQTASVEGVKQHKTSSKSNARREASAMIAKIPEVLSRHIARSFLPTFPLTG